MVAQQLSEINVDELLDQVDGLILRENGGYDFAAWAHALHYIDLKDTRLLCLVNDSLIGPIGSEGLIPIMARIREKDEDLVGLTENFEFKYHLQSFFLVAKGRAVSALAGFLEGVRMLDDKQEVIMSYELQLTDALKAEGFQAAALFPNSTSTNRTIKDWQGLIQEGFPFVKTAVLQDTDADGWENVLAQHGYDVSIAKNSLTLINEGISSDVGGPTSAKQSLSEQNASLSAALSEAAVIRRSAEGRVTELEKELTLVSKKPWKQVRRKAKFKLYSGLAKFSPPLSTASAARFQRRARKYDPNRFLQAPSHANAIAGSKACKQIGYEFRGNKAYNPDKSSVLVVSHQASRTGAPILALNIAERLSERYNVTSLCLMGGEILDNFAEMSEKVIDANLHSMDASNYSALLKRLCREREYSFAVVNSVESHALLKGLHDCNVPSVALLHEFASYTGKKTSFSEAIRWADETVFSTRLTMENALEFDQSTMDLTPSMTVLPQGKCRVPITKRNSATVEAEKNLLRELLRPAEDQAERFVVLGAGTVEIRKGVDLFLETATRVLNAPGGENIHFAWIGAGYDPNGDFAYSVYLRDQLKRAGLEERVTMIPATSEIDLAYELSNVFLLSSRLDPLPNVAINSMIAGLPVLCFEETSGVADLLIDAGLGKTCVARYIDTTDLANKLLKLANEPKLFEEVSRKTSDYAAKVLNIDRYVEQIEKLGLESKARAAARDQDVRDIVASSFFRDDFFLPIGTRNKNPAKVVEDYLEQLNWIAAARKPEPGFNPFVYADRAGQKYDRKRDAYADFLTKGRPQGPWLLPVLEGGLKKNKPSRKSELRSALHIHAYHVDHLPEIVSRLRANQTSPDLYVSVRNKSSEDKARTILADYRGHISEIQSVPNVGRDIGPFLTQFGARLINDYDIIGHVHLKKSAHLKDAGFVKAWSKFQLENVLGGNLGGSMIDLIMERFEVDEEIGLIYPDDPHIFGWTRNLGKARRLAARMGQDILPTAINFPLGTMFWMRAGAFNSFVKLELDWSDYPKEPIADDGTVLHALERLFGVIPHLEGWGTVVTNIQGVTR